LNSRLHVIAEAGTNHDGNLSQAKNLVNAALASGADSIKFQVIYPEGLYLPVVHSLEGCVMNPVLEIRARTALSDEEYDDLWKYARSVGMEISASVFDPQGIALLSNLGVSYIKIASCDLNNLSLISQAAELGRKLVISTGMASLAEIERTMEVLTQIGNTDVVLMHCVSIYPCPLEQMNLSFLTTLRKEFGCPIGLSDHTQSNLAGAAAIALGATWIEKHFTLDRNAEGFDHHHSIEPQAFALYCESLRSCAAALEPTVVKTTPEELSVRTRARRGLYAARDLPAGSTVQFEDILVVRPESALGPGELGLILGKRTSVALERYQPLTIQAFDSSVSN
jgi:N,N'-diacetyllegionaminate synthase